MNQPQADTLYFIEKFAPLVRDLKGTIIALAPGVCYQLDKENIAYQTYEDFYDLIERKQYAKECNRRKLSWFDSFDDYLKSKVAGPLDKKIDFVRLYGYSIVTLIDPFIIYSKNIFSVLNKTRPSKVCLITSPCSKIGFGKALFTRKIDLSSCLLPIICKKNGIAYSVINVDPEKSTIDFPFRSQDFFRRAFRAIGRTANNMHKQAVYLTFFFKRQQLRRAHKLKKFLILREDWLGDFYKTAAAAGHQVIFHQDEAGRFKVNAETADLWRKIGEECIKEFDPCQWVNSEAGADLRQVLNSRFLYFLEKICPSISLAAKKYERILKEEKINYVICQYKMYPSDCGVMAAAKLLPEVLSVQIQHGGGESVYHLHHFSELPADIYIASSKEEASFYDKFFNSGGTDNVKVAPARVWTDKYKQEAKRIARRSQKTAGSTRKEKIYYVPSLQSLQRLGSTYPVVWYFNLQRDLCRYFSKRPQYDFVIKASLSLRWLFEPLFKYLNDLKAPNIFYEEGDLIWHLRRADRVITDNPSTPTYEARLFGLPLISLYHESTGVRGTAKDNYGKTLVSFREPEEMIENIDRFLSSDPREYVIPMDDNLSIPNFLDVLGGSSNG